MKEKQYRNERIFIFIVLIFIALLVIIFLLVKDLGFIEHKQRILTGNIDIFDIIFQQSCNNNCSCTCNSCNNGDCKNCTNVNNCNNYNKFSNSNNSTDNGNYSYSDSNSNFGNNNNYTNNDNVSNTTSPTPPVKKEGIEVFDKQTEYSKDTLLNIFTNTTYYVVDNKIAPTSENSYQFVVRNNNDSNIKYSLELNEENLHKINMKYRLKLNGVYVAGNDEEWLTYDKLNQYDMGLSANNHDVYTLDWKWFESENDTEVGTNISSNYKLELKITASEY